MNPPPSKQKIITHPAPSKKVISSPQADPSTVDVSMNVEPAPTDAATTPIDLNQAVDYVGTPIKLGDVVDIYSCKVIGLRPDANNRMNVFVVPLFNNIVSPDPNNPLNGQVDGKGILISGYHATVIFSPTATGAERAPVIDAALALAQREAKDPAPPLDLPSNFLVPSLL